MGSVNGKTIESYEVNDKTIKVNRFVFTKKRLCRSLTTLFRHGRRSKDVSQQSGNTPPKVSIVVESWEKVSQVCDGIQEIMEQADTARQEMISKLLSTKDFKNRLLVFINDLIEFNNRVLNNQQDATMMSRTYLSEDEIEDIKNLPLRSGETLENRIYRLLSKQCQKKDYGACTNHLIAPVYMEAFGIDRSFRKKKSFQEVLKQFDIQEEAASTTGLNKKEKKEVAKLQAKKNLKKKDEKRLEKLMEKLSI
jgi:hypothetical protein